MSTFLMERGDLVLSLKPIPFLFGNNSFGCATLTDFLGLFSVSTEKESGQAH